AHVPPLFDALVDRGKKVRSFPGDLLAIDAELWLFAGREQKGQRTPPLGQLKQLEGVLWLVEILIEVVDAQLVEIAQHDVARAAGGETEPVFERLREVAREVLAALLHFDEDDGLPDAVGEGGAAAVVADA